MLWTLHPTFYTGPNLGVVSADLESGKSVRLKSKSSSICFDNFHSSELLIPATSFKYQVNQRRSSRLLTWKRVVSIPRQQKSLPYRQTNMMRWCFSFVFKSLFCLTLVLLASMKLAKSDVMSKLKQEIKFSAHTASRKCHRANTFGRWPICSRSISYVEHHILWSKSHSANCFRSLTMQCGLILAK